MIGRNGGYRLRPGFKLPPLMFTEEEAAAIALGLLGTAWLEIGLSSAAIEGALANVSHVLPLRARERMNAVAVHMILSPHRHTAQPDAELLINLSEAIQQRRRIAHDYHSYHDQITHRKEAFLQLAEQMTQIATLDGHALWALQSRHANHPSANRSLEGAPARSGAA
jgi:predicted DNA-binding transcriptional regulator YafY